MTHVDFSNISNPFDYCMLEILKDSGWTILGAGFKEEKTITAKETNQKLWDRATPWNIIMAFKSHDKPDGFWLAERDCDEEDIAN